MGKEMDGVGACLTCWLKDGGQRVGMALPRVILKRQKFYQAPAPSRDISSESPLQCTYQSHEALQKTSRANRAR